LDTSLVINLVEFRQRQTAIAFIVGVHEHTEIVILKVKEFGFLFLGKEFGVVLFPLGVAVVPLVSHYPFRLHYKDKNFFSTNPNLGACGAAPQGGF
jgi:hypothetical protein